MDNKTKIPMPKDITRFKELLSIDYVQLLPYLYFSMRITPLIRGYILEEGEVIQVDNTGFIQSLFRARSSDDMWDLSNMIYTSTNMVDAKEELFRLCDENLDRMHYCLLEQSATNETYSMRVDNTKSMFLKYMYYAGFTLEESVIAILNLYGYIKESTINEQIDIDIWHDICSDFVYETIIIQSKLVREQYRDMEIDINDKIYPDKGLLLFAESIATYVPTEACIEMITRYIPANTKIAYYDSISDIIVGNGWENLIDIIYELADVVYKRLGSGYNGFQIQSMVTDIMLKNSSMSTNTGEIDIGYHTGMDYDAEISKILDTWIEK